MTRAALALPSLRALPSLLALLAAWAPAGAEPVARRVVTLDWAATSMVLSLGVAPVGIADPDLYRRWVGEPALPAEAADVGLRTEPSLERIAELAPDLVLTSPLGAANRELLARIAPTEEVAIYTPARAPLARAAAALRDLGARLGREAEAEDAVARSEAVFAAARARLAGLRRPILLVGFLDARHVRVIGAGGLFHDVLARLGLRNAWDGRTSDWGFSLVGIEQLARHPEALVVVTGPLPAGVSLAAEPGTLWGSLPPVRAGRVVQLPPVWAFGDLGAATRFAALLAERLGDGDAAR